MDDERMITVDPNGIPYLSHAWNVKTPFRPKYYKKIKVPNEKDYRYFYSEREWQAYLKNQQATRSSPQSATPKRKKPISITSDDPNLESTNGWLAEQIADIKRRRQANLEKQRREKLEKEKDARRKAAGESLKRRDEEIQNAQKKAQESYQKDLRRKAAGESLKRRDEEIQNAQKKAQESYQKDSRQKEQERLRKERVAEVEKAEAEAARIEKKRQAGRQIPESVSLKDFIFGGQFRKDLKTSKRDLKKVQKELKRQTSKLSKLDEQIEELSAKKQTARNKKKLEQLQAQRAELQSSMIESRRQRLQAIQDYSAAMYRYERTTLVGKVKRQVRNGNKTAKKFIEKYSSMLLSKLPKIKTK